MAFLEVRFPESISFNSASILEFNTSIVQTKNGLEQRNMNWTTNKMKFNVVNGIKTKLELEELLTFFRLVRGRAYGFRFKDWSDYSAIGQQIGVGNGSTNEFQLVKTYQKNDKIYLRKITKPVISTINIYLNGNKITDFDVDLNNGVITFDVPPAVDIVVTADFEFDVPVRFDSDELEISLDTINSGKVKDLVLVETN